MRDFGHLITLDKMPVSQLLTPILKNAGIRLPLQKITIPINLSAQAGIT
jgi:hypothetical protein